MPRDEFIAKIESSGYEPDCKPVHGVALFWIRRFRDDLEVWIVLQDRAEYYEITPSYSPREVHFDAPR